MYQESRDGEECLPVASQPLALGPPQVEGAVDDRVHQAVAHAEEEYGLLQLVT